jgi:hypothetical protein
MVTNDTGIGALYGMQFAGPYGAGVGAIIGFRVGMVKMLMEMDRTDLIVPAILLPGAIGLLTFDEG